MRAFPADSRTVYLLLYLATDRPRELFSDLELPKLRVRFNGMTIADELTPRYAEFYEDAPPLVLEMGDYLRYGKNSVELRVDPFADIGLRLRRLEIRTRLSALAYYDEWPE